MVKAPFQVHVKDGWALMALRLIKVRTFSPAHPKGVVTFAPIYDFVQALPSRRTNG